MRVIIRCAGTADRWGNHLDVPKHLAPLCGERVLHRTVRQVLEYDPDADVRVVVPSLDDPRYKIPGTRRHTDKPTPAAGEIDKIASTLPLHDREDRTVVLFGDVFWDDGDIDSILGDPVDGWGAWLRVHGDGGEIFGFAFAATPAVERQVHDAVDTVTRAHQTGDIDGVPGGWALYRALTGSPLTNHADHGHAHPVSAWTADMDEPADWDTFCYQWATADPADRPPTVPADS